MLWDLRSHHISVDLGRKLPVLWTKVRQREIFWPLDRRPSPRSGDAAMSPTIDMPLYYMVYQSVSIELALCMSSFQSAMWKQKPNWSGWWSSCPRKRRRRCRSSTCRKIFSVSGSRRIAWACQKARTCFLWLLTHSGKRTAKERRSWRSGSMRIRVPVNGCVKVQSELVPSLLGSVGVSPLSSIDNLQLELFHLCQVAGELTTALVAPTISSVPCLARTWTIISTLNVLVMWVCADRLGTKATTSKTVKRL